MKALGKKSLEREKTRKREEERREIVRETDSEREGKRGKRETERAVGVIGPQAMAG